MVRNGLKYQFRVNWGWTGCFRCEKFRHDFVARTFAVVRNVLPRVSHGNQMVANAPKSYKTHQNMSLGSHGVDWVLSLRKIPTRLRVTNFCTSSKCFALSFVRQPNGRKYTQTEPKHTKNMSLATNGVDRVGSSRKILTRLRGTNFCTFVPFCPEFCKAT